MTSYERIDVDERGNGLCAGQMTNSNEVVGIAGPVNSAQVLFRHEVRLIANGGVLRDATPESTRPLGFSNELHGHPSIPVRLSGGQCLWDRSRADLGHDPEQIGEANGDSNETPDLADAIALAVNERQPRRRVLLECDADRPAPNVLHDP